MLSQTYIIIALGAFASIVVLFDDPRWKKKVRISAILIIVIGFCFQVHFESEKSKKEENAERKTDSNWIDISKKLASTLAKLNKTYSNVELLDKRAELQLGYQKQLYKSSNTLVTENKKLLSKQGYLSQSVDNLNYPVFPADIILVSYAPLIDKKNDFIAFLYRLKAGLENQPKSECKECSEIVYKAKTNEIESFILELNVDTAMRILPDLNTELRMLASHTITISSSKNFDDMRSLNTGFSTDIGYSYDGTRLGEVVFIRLGIDFKRKQLFITQFYKNNKFKRFFGLGDIPQSMLSFNELKNKYVSVMSHVEIPSFKILAIEISQLQGLQENCYIVFEKRDTTAKYGLPFHKISKSDFDDKYFNRMLNKFSTY